MRILGRSNPARSPSLLAGFTLPEVVIAVGILGVSFVSLYAGMSAGFAMTQVSRENLRATQIMVEKMEGIRLFNWNQVVASNMIPTQFATRYYPNVGGAKATGIAYNGTISITNATLNPAPSYASNLRFVTVGVEWQSGDVARRRTMTTMVSRNGLQNYVYDR
ncbi:MAG: prepilin-type N-terminal cleavage/methylation domain-containing protein [Verrucomicrobia bacterium]|jgi:prepilin-type N-terminal cleavage/methylation domain-containing protein|nr:prepilin-type N-terminal cleavage/methylation domain-containing protein [Verrucomicrobiota bacterium]